MLKASFIPPLEIRELRELIRYRQTLVTEHTAVANEQHYEVPTRFFELVLGPHLKYSSCSYPQGAETLAEAEAGELADRAAPSRPAHRRSACPSTAP